MSRICVQSALFRGIHPADEGVLLGKVDPVVLLFAGDPLAPGLQGHPEVPAQDLVVHIILGILHKFSGGDILQRERRRLR